MEAELFGYERGAFTGAVATKEGRIELAHQGTLFLDEIAELDFATQSKLLQLLQDGAYYPIGGKKDMYVNVRVICATNRELQREIELGTFRRDLYYRINVGNVRLPALRERVADMVTLATFFLTCYNQEFNRNAGPLLNVAARRRL